MISSPTQLLGFHLEGEESMLDGDLCMLEVLRFFGPSLVCPCGSRERHHLTAALTVT